MKQSKKKDLLLLANKLIEKIPDTVNAKEHYQSFIRKKNNKLVKKTKNNYSSTKNFGKPKHCWYKISYYKNAQKRHINYPRL